MNAFINDIARISLTAITGLTVGYGLSILTVPAPFMLGSLFGTWILGASVPPAQAYLGTPRWMHKVIVLGLATMIGTSFTPEVFQRAQEWWFTTLLMILATILAAALGYAFLAKFRRQPHAQALLSALPGGQADIMAIARDYADKDYLVALVHLCRVVAVFLSMPLMLAWLGGAEAVADSYEKQANLPRLQDVSPLTAVQLVGVALTGFGVARLLRFPMPHLLGPLVLSLVLHALGIFSLPRLYEFVVIAQLTIAGTIGARLAHVPIREVAGGLVDGFITAVILIGCFLVMAVFAAYLLDASAVQLILAFIPGGLYEVTLLALIFGFDLAFVAFHHTVRILLIFFTLPTLIKGQNG